MRKSIAALATATLILGSVPAQADIWDRAKDVVRTWSDPSPRASSRVNYQNGDRFDVHLHRSLKRNYHNVSVNFTQSNLGLDNMPNRAERWLSEVDRKGGKVKYCATGGNFGLVDFFGSLLFGWAQDWVTYGPAKKYDAYIMLDSKQHVDRIVFFHKRSDWKRPANCVDYFVEQSNDLVY